MENQRGVASWGFIILLFAFAIGMAWWGLYDVSHAPAEDIQAVVTVAAQSPAASKIVKDFLANTPSPTNKQLAELRSKINDQVVLDLRKTVTGNTALTPSPAPVLKPEKSVADVYRDSPWIIFGVGILGVLCLVGFLANRRTNL